MLVDQSNSRARALIRVYRINPTSRDSSSASRVKAARRRDRHARNLDDDLASAWPIQSLRKPAIILMISATKTAVTHQPGS